MTDDQSCRRVAGWPPSSAALVADAGGITTPVVMPPASPASAVAVLTATDELVSLLLDLALLEDTAAVTLSGVIVGLRAAAAHFREQAPTATGEAMRELVEALERIASAVHDHVHAEVA